MQDEPLSLADDLLQGAEAAGKYLGLERRTIYRMVEAGEIPHVRKGKKIFFRKSALDKAFSAEFFEITPTLRSMRIVNEPPPGKCTTAELVGAALSILESENTSVLATKISQIRTRTFGRSGKIGRGNTVWHSRKEAFDVIVMLALGRLGIGAAGAAKLYQRFPIPDPADCDQWEIPHGKISYLTVALRPLHDQLLEHLPHLAGGMGRDEQKIGETEENGERASLADSLRDQSDGSASAHPTAH